MNTRPLFKKQTALYFLPLLLLFSLFSCSLPGSLDFNRNFYSGLSLTIPRYAPWIQEAGKNRALGFTDKVELLVKNDKKEIVFEETYRGGESHSEGILLNVPLPVGENYTLEISLFNHQVSPKHPTLRGTSTPFSIKAGAATPLTLYCTPVEPQSLNLSPKGEEAESFTLVSTLLDAKGVPLRGGGEKWFHLQVPAGEKNPFKPGVTVSTGAAVYFCLFNKDGRPAGTRFRGWEDILASLKPGQEYYLGVFAGSREVQKEVEVHIQFPKDKKSIIIHSNGAHGDESVTASPDTAAQGTRVTLSAQLEKGRKVELRADGVTFSVDSIETNAGTATFIMPDKDVNIKAAFSYIVPPAKEITSFVFEKAKNSFLTSDITAIMDEVNHKITAVVPYGIDLSAEDLIPTVTLSSGAAVSPASGASHKFDTPVTYTVTAEDGTTQIYTVEVSAALNSAAAITGFVFEKAKNSFLTNDVTATIDEGNHKITAVVPYGTDLSAEDLIPTVTLSSGAAVSPASGISHKFDNPVTYTVTAADGTTTQAYTVDVSVAPNSAAAITGFVFETAQNSFLTSDVTAAIDEGNHKITATLPYGTDLSALIPAIILSPKAAVSPASGAVQDFSTSSNYTVTAENGTTQVYLVEVITAPKPVKVINGSSADAWAELKAAVEGTGAYAGTLLEEIIINGEVKAAAGSSGEILVPGSRTVTIKGNGADAVINANCTATGEEHRIFKIETGGNLSIENLSLKGGVLPASGGTPVPSNGGAVLVESGSSFTMNNSIITGNNASNGQGGGVYVEGSFVMNDGSITNNNASEGGGVYSAGAFTMNNGRISNNAASSGYGGGVFLDSSQAFTMQGGAQIGTYSNGNLTDNNYVYLTEDRKIRVDDLLSGTSATNPAAVIQPETYPSGGAGIQVLDGDALSDNLARFKVKANGTEEWEIDSSGMLQPAPVALPVMIDVTGGTFTMGDTWGGGAADQKPVHSVTLSDFKLGESEVTYAQWKSVYDWAVMNGYNFAPVLSS